MPYCSKHGISKITSVEKKGTLLEIQFQGSSGLFNKFYLEPEQAKELLLELYRLGADKTEKEDLPIGKDKEPLVSRLRKSYQEALDAKVRMMGLPTSNNATTSLLLALRRSDSWTKDPLSTQYYCGSFEEYCEKVIGMTHKEVQKWVTENP
jgi:hypothetical protein